jgi:selenocysteine lyase/cysteine desulfurase
MERVYLDHAATSWPKPPGVVEAFVDFQTHVGATAGRGAYSSAQKSNRLVAAVRSKLSDVINAGGPERFALTANGTAALNLGLLGYLREGDRVITTTAEHNSVLRPLTKMQREQSLDLVVLPVDECGLLDLDDLRHALNKKTRLVAVTHASNVTGFIQPLSEISRIAKQFGASLLVDAAQTLGYYPMDVRAYSIDMLAAPGHKGACGLLGTGFLYASEAAASQIISPWTGGTGSKSDDLNGPFAWPSEAEAGNLNVPALAGWSAGLDWLAAIPMDQRMCEGDQKRRRLQSILSNSRLGKIVGVDCVSAAVPVVSVIAEKSTCAELAAILDSSFGIEVRSGLHCAGLIHEFVGSKAAGGTLRFSLGHTSTDRDLDLLEQACEAIRDFF